MKPCDCLDLCTLQKLSETGVGYNNYSINVQPSSVVIAIDPYVSIKLPQHIFKRFAEWYLDDQD